MKDESTTLEFYSLNLPPEPPIGSVLLGEDNVSYQSGEGQDGRTGKKITIYSAAMFKGDIYNEYYGRSLSWAQLLIEKQPLRLVYRAETKEEENKDA